MSRPRTTPRTRGVVATAYLSLFMVSADNSIINTAVPRISASLGAGTPDVQMAIDAYMLVFASSLIIAGSLVDRMGARRSYALGVGVFTAASLLGACAPSVPALVLSRAGMGVGAAFVVPSIFGLFAAELTDDGRRRVLALWPAVVGLGVAVGPVLGGLLLTRFWYGSIFLLNVPVGVLALIGTAVLILPVAPAPAARRPSPVGAVLLLIGIGLFASAVIFAVDDRVPGWLRFGLGAAGLLTLVGYTVHERRTDRPLFDLGYFRERKFTGAVVAMSGLFFALFGTVFLAGQFTQYGLGWSPLQAGAGLLPLAVGLTFASLTCVRFTTWRGPRAVVATGLGLGALGCALCAAAATDLRYPLLAAGLLSCGLGMGWSVGPALTLIVTSLRPADAGVGSSVNAMFQQICGAGGVAVMGLVFSAGYGAKIADTPGLPTAARTVGGGYDLLAHGSRQSTSWFVHGIGSGLLTAWIIGAVVASAAVVTVLLVLPSAPTTAASLTPGSRKVNV
ncbi:MFS transporter [Streptomyces sp. NPDC007971]|uniref:MFS transporter n=1 Tax=unclassified Streptomyces TaxID=2593676 RepID=UPI0036EC4359